MKAFNPVRRDKTASPARRTVALLSVLALLSNTFFVGVAGAQQQRAAQAQKRLSEDERIVHVLNRLGFGPRPGDVERVRQVGLERYIEQQLRPEGIRDEAAEAKVKHLPTLSMPTSELLAKYPNPGRLIRQLQRRGELPADLAAVVENRRNGNQARNKSNEADKTDRMEGPSTDAMTGGPEDKSSADKSKSMTNNPNANNPAQAGEGDRKEYRRAILDYMRENGLQNPQRLTAELQASRILKAVYSERQLHEVMVDFWTNHFNVFANKGADRWFLTSYDRDVIRPHSLGKFRDLLGATARSPAMLFYLDNFQSVSPNAGGAGMGKGGRRALM
ncbi:MAG: DUF1800 family protein, partial [Pyrinomonadaceae bacterium]